MTRFRTGLKSKIFIIIMYSDSSILYNLTHFMILASKWFLNEFSFKRNWMNVLDNVIISNNKIFSHWYFTGVECFTLHHSVTIIGHGVQRGRGEVAGRGGGGSRGEGGRVEGEDVVRVELGRGDDGGGPGGLGPGARQQRISRLGSLQIRE